MQVLDQQYIVVDPDGAGTRRRLGTVRIMLSLEKLQSVSNTGYSGQQGYGQGSVGLGVGGPHGSVGLGVGGLHGSVGRGHGPEYNTAWELEMWKKAEEAAWRAELADKEHVSCDHTARSTT